MRTAVWPTADAREGSNETLNFHGITVASLRWLLCIVEATLRVSQDEEASYYAHRRERMLKQSGRAVLSPGKQPQAQSVIVVEQQSRSASVETGRQLDRA
ncbi:hypothetical protein PI126_g20970 [Phytophthora idaei]|nr:hypothetical protein PI126_g20970 [Phytophthora idaei]